MQFNRVQTAIGWKTMDIELFALANVIDRHSNFLNVKCGVNSLGKSNTEANVLYINFKCLGLCILA